MLKVFGEVKCYFRHLLSCRDWSLQSLLSIQAVLLPSQHWWYRECKSAQSHHYFSTCLRSSMSQSISKHFSLPNKICQGYGSHSELIWGVFPLSLVLICRKVVGRWNLAEVWLHFMIHTELISCSCLSLPGYCCSGSSGQLVHHILYDRDCVFISFLIGFDVSLSSPSVLVLAVNLRGDLVLVH